MGMVGGEAFGLLLKRPWNPVAGMHPLDRQVRQLGNDVTPEGFTPMLANGDLERAKPINSRSPGTDSLTSPLVDTKASCQFMG